MSLISKNAPGVVQSITATMICSLAVLAWNRFKKRKPAPTAVTPGRNIGGYVCGWLVMAVVVPVFVYLAGKLPEENLVQLIVIDATTISVIGWLDKYPLDKKKFWRFEILGKPHSTTP